MFSYYYYYYYYYGLVVVWGWLCATTTLTTVAAAHNKVEPCGTRPRPRSERWVEQVRLQHLAAARGRRNQHHDGRVLYPYKYQDLCQQCVEIDVHFHFVLADIGFGPFIPHPLPSSSALVLDESLADELQNTQFSTEHDIFSMIESNMQILNDAFQATPFRFRLVPEKTQKETNLEWSNYARDGLLEMSTTLGSNDPSIMDVNLVFRIASKDPDYNGAKGVAYLPSTTGEGVGYGVCLRYDILTRGGYNKSDMGYTFVHEVGHWLGLEHTFTSQVEGDDSCNPADPNDFVDDTPAQAGPSTNYVDNCVTNISGGEPPVDTCPNLPGVDPLFNYMNYVDSDVCWDVKGEFTPQQIERMYLHWLLYRDKVTNCEDPNEMEIELVIFWDKDHATDNWIRLVEQESGVLVFDSNRDYRKGIAFEYQRSLSMDLCVPRTSTYILKIYDRFGDGFLNGKIDVFRDGVLLESLEGSCPRSVEVAIPAMTPAPTLTPTAVPTIAMPTSPPASPPPSQTPADNGSNVPPSPDNPSGVPSMFDSRTTLAFLAWIVGLLFFL